MARTSDAELERLKSDVSVQRLAEARGVELRRHGADLHGRCPFHDDRTPSLVVSPVKNLWHCLGACQTGGSVIDWVMKAEGVSFRHAVEILRADVPLAGPVKSVKTSSVRKLEPPVNAAADDRAALKQVVDYYHATLKQSPEALAYLESRGLKSSEMIEVFKLGYANRTLGLRLPMKAWKSGAEVRGRLQTLGIIRDSGHEHFNGSIVVPIFDETGGVVEMYGRKITPNLRPGTPLHLYLPGPHRGVWNAAAVKGARSIILCESLIDAMTFWCAGFRNVTAAYGVEGFTAEHLELLRNADVEEVVLAFDRDEAGDKGAEKVAAALAKAGMRCRRGLFPKGMDANEYAQKVQPAAKSLELVLRKAPWMDGSIDVGRTDHALPLLAAALVTTEAAATPVKPLAPEGNVVAALQAPATRKEARDEVAAAVAPAATAKPPAPASPPPSAPVAAASPVPTPSRPATPEVAYEMRGEEVSFTFGERRYRVRGLPKNTAYDVLKVNILTALGERFHVDTFDVYAARQRAIYVKQVAHEIGVEEDVVKSDLGKVLLKLEQLQDEQIQAALKPKETVVTLTEAEREEALEFLQAPNLLDRILEDFERCGVVGEETNKLVGYVASVSRKLEDPLAVIIQSSSAAGKSSLMEAVLAFMPEEDRVKYSAMTGQSLFYMGEANLKHKILAVVEEEGAARASYALKILQSEGELTIASTGKDPETGKLVTHEYRVEGPVMIFLTTTAIEIDDELMNRCIVLSVDEDRRQTQAIHRIQRERQTLEGLLAREDKRGILKLHRNAQRLLRPLMVANPYAKQLTFLDDRTRTRRDHTKYLTIIRTIALLHQYQRPVKTANHRGRAISYIEVTVEDIAVANRLAHHVLGRSLDELPPQTRRLLLLLDGWVASEGGRQKIERADFRFSRRQVREATGWGYEQLRVHLERLVELEYLLVHRGTRGQSFSYELIYDGHGKDGAAFLSGLLDVSALGQSSTAAATTISLGGQGGEFVGLNRGQTGAEPAGADAPKSAATAAKQVIMVHPAANAAINGHRRPETKPASYVVASGVP